MRGKDLGKKFGTSQRTIKGYFNLFCLAKLTSVKNIHNMLPHN